jgi:hypothetical protein
MPIPLVGDGEYIEAGNSTETLILGRSTRPVMLGSAAGSSVGFYGKVPAARRAFNSAVHVTTNIATSASFGATQLAVIQEIQNTLIGVGLWPTA